MNKTIIIIATILVMYIPVTQAQTAESGLLKNGLKIGLEADYNHEIKSNLPLFVDPIFSINTRTYRSGVFVNLYLSKRFFIGPYYNTSKISANFDRGSAGDTLFANQRQSFGLQVGYDFIKQNKLSLAFIGSFGYSTTHFPEATYLLRVGAYLYYFEYEDFIYSGFSNEGKVIVNYRLHPWLEVGAYVGLNYTNYQAETTYYGDNGPYGLTFDQKVIINDTKLTIPMGISVSYVINNNP